MNLISFQINTVKTWKRQFPRVLSIHVTAGLLFFSLFFLVTGCSIKNHSAPAGHDNESPSSRMIQFYQGPLNHLNAVRYGGCPMHPGCSDYGLSAIEKHGVLIGWMMTFDRLIRCGRDETRLSPEVLVNSSWKYIDTLEQNDFWWCNANKNTALINTQPAKQSLDWGISIE